MKIGDRVSTQKGNGTITAQATAGWMVALDSGSVEYFVYTRIRPIVTTEEMPPFTAEDRNNKLAGLTREEDD